MSKDELASTTPVRPPTVKRKMNRELRGGGRLI